MAVHALLFCAWHLKLFCAWPLKLFCAWHLKLRQGSEQVQLKTCLDIQVTIRDLDPKSISTQELYGYVNMSTREWKDGLLSYNMRELANLPDDNPKWILLDGDLDANW